MSSNSSLWVEIWQTSPNSKSEIVCPLLLQSPVIAVLITAMTSSDREWILAAYLQRKIFTGLTTIDGKPDAKLNFSKKLWLNKLQLFTYSVKCEYELSANCFIYGNGINLTVWEYTGEIN
ncbi:hypothetical protein QUA71_28100 [Microcoleus sp. MON1_C5]|uniref:hypothetical protein n=1 Tax=Microcoleus sp. MON1_C5 TaxID=2818828 RepID=UPI002FCE8816